MRLSLGRSVGGSTSLVDLWYRYYFCWYNIIYSTRFRRRCASVGRSVGADVQSTSLSLRGGVQYNKRADAASIIFRGDARPSKPCDVRVNRKQGRQGSAGPPSGGPLRVPVGYDLSSPFRRLNEHFAKFLRAMNHFTVTFW